MSMNLLLFDELSENIFIFPFNSIFLEIMIYGKKFMISLCKIKQFNFNTNMINFVNHHQKIGMIFLNELFEKWNKII